MVECSMKAEGASADGRRHRVGDQRVARGAADALAHPVHEPDGQYLGGRLRQADERPHHRSERVPRDHERLAAPHTVRPPAARELEQRGRGLRRSLDRAHRAGTGAEHGAEKEREQRVDHLARHVGEETHHGERDDVAAEPWTRCRQRVHGSVGA
jgi:hypothetical protein